MVRTPSVELTDQTVLIRLAEGPDRIGRPVQAVIDRTGLGDLCAVEILDLAAQLPGVQLPPFPPRGQFPSWSYDTGVDAMWVVLLDDKTHESLDVDGEAFTSSAGDLLSLTFEVPGLSYLATPRRRERWRH